MTSCECPKCNGRMFRNYVVTKQTPHGLDTLMCVNCALVLDEVIVHNKSTDQSNARVHNDGRQCSIVIRSSK